MSKRIVTVLGEIEPGELGYCQSHEHILLRRGQSYKVNPALCMEDPARSLAEVQSYYRCGGRSLVDAQPVGCGRMAEELREISEISGVSIIASTGFHKLIFYPEDHWIRTMNEQDLIRLWKNELQVGMHVDGDREVPQERSDIRAGQIKTALDAEGMSPRYKTLFRAASSVMLETGAPMMIHIEPGSDPMKLCAFLLGRMVPMDRMIFCHMDRATPDLNVHKAIARSGAFLEYDTIGRAKYHSDEEEIRIIKAMIHAGFEDQLLFSLDTTAKRMGAYEGTEVTLCYILEHFLEKMLKAGISERVIRKMSVDNPARAFAYLDS